MHELRRTGAARRTEQAARKDALDKLWRSYVARAQAGRFSRRPGQRLDGLEALRQAVPIARSLDAPRSSLDELRDEAIACLALPDMRPAKSGIESQPGGIGPVFDGLFQRYALADSRGVVRVYRTGVEPAIATISETGGVPERLWISPDGMLVALARPDGLQIRAVESGRVVLERPGKVGRLQFTADSRRAAIGCADGTIVLTDLTACRDVARLRVDFTPTLFALRPDARQIAIADPRRSGGVEIWDLDPPRKSTPLHLGEGGPALELAWSPDGRRLALGLGNDQVGVIWDVADQRPVVTLAGHSQQITGLSFHPDGNLILSHSWDGSARLWNAGTGRQLLAWPSSIGDLHFSRDGKACGFVTVDGQIRVLEAESGPEYRTLVVGLGADLGGYCRAGISSDDLLAVGMEDGIRLWELDSGRELAFLPIGWTSSVEFIAGKRGRELLSCGAAGLQRWAIREDGARPGRLHVGTPRTIPLTLAPSIATVGSDGRTAIVACEPSGKAIILDLEDEAIRCTLAPHPALNRGSLSADGRWAATSGWHTPVIKIWDAHTGSPVKELPVGLQNTAFFSPSGPTLITSGGAAYRFWDASSWQLLRELPWDIPSYPGWVAFSRDHALLAIERSPAVVHLVDAATGRTLARLADPSSDRAGWLGFSADGSRLVMVSFYSRAIHVWDLRRIARGLAAVGLPTDALAPAGRLEREAGRPQAVEIVTDPVATSGSALQQKARAEIERFRQDVAAHPDRAANYNNLAWIYLTAPEPLRDPELGMAMVRKSLELEPGNPAYRNTLGLAYYRVGQYREAAKTLQADLESQEDRYIAWDFCFLAMTYHQLGDSNRAREFRNLARRWSRDQKGLPIDLVHELSTFRQEMEALLAK